ncbi:MAG: ABC transporter ATP-binding protein [Anaerolineaceae bacterium]|nr:ABC transporter ATP-binding protein [Anaerolineaceae bacterium]
MKNIKRILSYLQQYKKYAILAPLTVSLEVLLEIWIPYLMADIIDVGITNKDTNYVVRIGGLMALAALISLVLGALAGRFGAMAATGLSRNLRRAMFNKIQDFSFSNTDHFSTPSLITRMTTDMNFVQNSVQMIVRMLIRGPLMMVAAIFMTFHINSELAVIYLIAVPFLALSIALIFSKAHGYFIQMFKKYDKLNGSIQENLIGIRVVKSFVRRDFENEKFIKSATDVMDMSMKAERYVTLNGPIMMLTVNVCIIALLWFGGKRIIIGNMQAGELISFINYTNQILIQLMMISMVMVTLVISRESMARILEVLDEKPDLTDDKANPALIPANGEVRFDHVSFNYAVRKDDNDMTLSDIDLDIPSGSMIGVIGGTGSGKSTFVQLIPRLYDVSKGSVQVAGHDVKDYTLKNLRDAVAIVLQKNVLFSGTIKENLKWGNENATDEEIIAACKAAQAHDFIMAFPEGYDTELTQGGTNVSGGQKQRLCIARALLKNPKVMILDDSTSAVDTATESAIRDALRTRYKNITTIIIAQRITSVMDADKIIVLDEGRVNGFDTHEELMKSNEIYREVYESQQKGAK